MHENDILGICAPPEVWSSPRLREVILLFIGGREADINSHV